MTNNRKTLLLLLCIFALFTVHCKKNPTVPNADVLNRPIIWLNSFEFTFAASIVGGNPVNQILQIKNTGKEPLNYTIGSDSAWVSISEKSGASTGQVNSHTITIDKTGMQAQETPHTATLTIESDDAYNNPQKVTVSLMLTTEPPPTFQVNPKNLTFSGKVNGANPASQDIFIQNTGGSKLVYTITTDKPWLSVIPETGESKVNRKTIKVSVNTSGINKGTYTGKIQISDPNATNNPQIVNVTLNMTDTAPPRIGVRPNKLSFSSFTGGANPAAQSLYINNTGEGTLNYTLAGDAGWLTVSPSGGSTAGVERRHTVSANIGGLSAGIYYGNILVEDSNASNSPVAVGVTLTISSPLTDNKVGISISPASGGTNTIVTISVFIRGNTSLINQAFGLDMNYDPTFFEYQNTIPGNLTSSWSVGGGASSGKVTIGGFRGIGSVIPIGSQGNIAIVSFKVIYSGTNTTRTITINNLIDDIAGMVVSPSTVTFTFN